MFSRDFPKLKEEGFQITSEVTFKYNCIAWAMEDDQQWWWPDSFWQFFWPLNIPREETVDAFIECFKSFGYEVCDTDIFENNYQKVALYADIRGNPTHAARQLPNGKWTSKLGANHDIEHTLEGLESEKYGTVARIFKKDNSVSLNGDNNS